MKNELQQHNPVIIANVEQASQAFSVANLIMHPYAMERVEKYAQKMAASKNMLPSCFHDDVSACEALIIQAASLNMNPDAIGRHAFKAPNGTINFEAKVFQAIAEVGVGIEFEVEYIGDWDRVINSGAQRNKASLADEKGVGIALTGTWYKNGKLKTRTLTVYMAQCMPRLSVNWNNDPKLQTYYAAIKKFMRQFCPGAIMGVFDRDDISHEFAKPEREINPAESQDPLGDIVSGAQDVIDGEVVGNEPIDQPKPETSRHEAYEANPDCTRAYSPEEIQAAIDSANEGQGEAAEFEEFTPPTVAQEIEARIKETTCGADLKLIGTEIRQHVTKKTLKREEVEHLQNVYTTQGAKFSRKADK